MKKVLVTGGAGFIGSHLCERLIKEGDYVICVDNLYTGRIKNLKKIIDNPHFEFINHDVIEALRIQVDEVYNLACPASPIYYQIDPIQTIKTNFLGTMNMLHVVEKTGAKLLQASTSEVYGDPLVHPQIEEYWGNVNPIGIRSCYDEGKRIAETLCFDYHRKHNTRIKVVRIFNTYGPNMNSTDGRVVSNFIVQALNDDNITVYGDGSQTRSFCYIDDLIEGLIRMMGSDESITGPFNFGNPVEFNMLELAEMIIEQTKSSSKIIFKELPEDDPKQRKPNINKAKQYLGWEPKTSLKEGIDKTIAYFKEQ